VFGPREALPHWQAGAACPEQDAAGPGRLSRRRCCCCCCCCCCCTNPVRYGRDHRHRDDSDSRRSPAGRFPSRLQAAWRLRAAVIVAEAQGQPAAVAFSNQCGASASKRLRVRTKPGQSGSTQSRLGVGQSESQAICPTSSLDRPVSALLIVDRTPSLVNGLTRSLASSILRYVKASPFSGEIVLPVESGGRRHGVGLARDPTFSPAGQKYVQVADLVLSEVQL
jgi:hypothetical protein